MAEKLLTGASFKAPDWKGPTVATAALVELSSDPAAAASATAKHALDIEMPDVEGDAAAMAFGARPDAYTPAPPPAIGLTAAAAPSADAPAPMLCGAALQVSAGPMPSGSHMQLDPQQQLAKAAALLQQPAAPPAARRPMTVIRQPGWQPPPQPQQGMQQQLAAPQLLNSPLTLQPPPLPQPLTHVNDLPDDLLQRIFSMLPFRKR